MIKQSLAAAATLMLALTGCTAHGPDDGGELPPPPPPVDFTSSPTFDEVAIDTAERVCEIDSLRAQRDDRIEQARELIISGYGLGADTNARSETRYGELEVDMPPAGPQTERTELVRAFELDLDAAYRFASGACRSYALCMHQRGYEEAACGASRAAWDRAQDRFSEVSMSLADIRAEIATRGSRPYRASQPRRQADRPCSGASCERDCEGVIGDLFTTNPC